MHLTSGMSGIYLQHSFELTAFDDIGLIMKLINWPICISHMDNDLEWVIIFISVRQRLNSMGRSVSRNTFPGNLVLLKKILAILLFLKNQHAREGVKSSWLSLPQEFTAGQLIGISGPALLLKRYHPFCRRKSCRGSCVAGSIILLVLLFTSSITLYDSHPSSTPGREKLT